MPASDLTLLRCGSWRTRCAADNPRAAPNRAAPFPVVAPGALLRAAAGCGRRDDRGNNRLSAASSRGRGRDLDAADRSQRRARLSCRRYSRRRPGDPDRETILSALDARPGTPMLAIDPARAKEKLESLPWVHSAVIERRFPDTISVHLVERVPMALWQHGGKIELIDRTG